MIDKIYITTGNLDKDLYNKLYKTVEYLSEEAGSILHPIDKTKGRYITNYLCDKGFTEIVFRSKFDEAGFISRRMEIELKPKKLIDPSNYSDVTYYFELQNIRKQFNSIMSKISPELPDFFNWICFRVEYAITIWTEIVEKHIILLKKGDTGKVFRKRAAEHFDKPGSVYLKTLSDDIRKNFYDKFDERKTKGDPLGATEDYISAKNKLRLEVQCNNQKLINIKNKYRLKSKTVGDLLRLDICRYVITEAYEMVAGSQDYVKAKKAIEMLKAKKHILHYKIDELTELLSFIILSGSIWKAREAFWKSDNAFDKRLRDIRKAGINPTLIPEEWEENRILNLKADIIRIFEDLETEKVKMVENLSEID